MNPFDISVSRDAVADPDVIAADTTADQPDVSHRAAMPREPAQTARQPVVPQAAGSSVVHESARAQVAGAATYVDDIPEIKGTLYAAPVMSTVAHGRLISVDVTAALAMPGVRDVILARDIPGDPILGNFSHDEPVFAQDRVEHIGQVIGVVVADSVMQARRAARKVTCHIEALVPVLNVRDAIKAQSYVLPPVFVKRARIGAAHAARHAQRRRPGAFLPGRPGRLCVAARAKPVADLFQHPAPRRSAALGCARFGH